MHWLLTYILSIVWEMFHPRLARCELQDDAILADFRIYLSKLDAIVAIICLASTPVSAEIKIGSYF